MKKPVRILIVEDKSDDADLARHEIRRIFHDCEFQVVETRERFIQALESFHPDVILSDYTLPRFDGMKALKLTLQHTPLTPLIIWTDSISEDAAVGCVKAGANNYLLKDNLKRLGPAILRALQEKELLIARKQAEQKYQSIFENSIEGIFQSSPGGRYLSLNPAMARLYGYASPGEMIESIQDIATQIYVEPEKRSAFVSLLNAQNGIENFEARNYRKDGSIIWTSTSARTVRDPHGKLLYYEGFLQDITQRKSMEDALQQSEHRFRALIENGLDDISLLAMDGTLLWESPSAIRNLGYTPDEYVGRNIFELMHPEDLEWTRSNFVKLLHEPGARQRAIFRLRRADGAWRWIEAIATNMLGEPAVNAIVINYRDITEQKQAELEVQQKNADLALINTLNELVNRGEGLDVIVDLVRDGLKRIFASQYTNIYLLDQDRQTIQMQHYSLPPDIVGKIERLIGRPLPAINIPVQQDGYFQRVLRAEQGIILSGPEVIQKWMGEFIETASLPPVARAAIRKLLPQIHRVLNIRSTVLVPLISDSGPLGLVNVSGPDLFTEQDLQRIENICGQLTTALRRKEVEDALRESQSKYQHLVETSHDLIWSIDAEARFTFVNPASREIYGYEPEELIGRSFLDVMDPEYYHHTSESFQEAIALVNEAKAVETYVRHRDGRQIILSANSIVLRDQQGNITGVVGSSHDITARKQAEEALKEERNLLRTLVDNIPDRIYAMDLQGRKTLSNTADWKASGGKTMADVIGKTDFDTYPSDLAEEFWKLDRAVLDSGQPVVNYEEPGLDADGNRVSILTTKIPLHDEKGKVIGLVGIGRDITERKQVEEALRQSQDRYRTLIETQTEFIVRWKPDGTRTFANESYCRYFGITPEQALSSNFMDLIHVPDRQNVETKIQRLKSGTTRVETEIHQVIKPDGSVGWQEWTDQAIRDENGLLVEFQSVGRDITERRQAEVERQAHLEIMQALANTKDLQELLRLVHGSIAKVIFAENFFVILHQPGTGLFEEIYSVDQYDPPAPPAKLENSITAYVFRSGKPLLLTKDSFQELASRGHVKLVGTDSASWLGVPLKISGRTIGVMAVQDYEHHNRYAERETEFLASIATQVALVIERKRAEEALRESEEHYRTIFEGVQDAIFVESLDGRILMVNERACEMYGYSQKEFLTRTVADMVPEGAAVLSADQAGVSLAIEPRESENRRANGEIFPIEISGRVQVISGETVLLVVVRDITERKRSGDLLRESEERFSSAFEYASIGMALVTTDGHWSRVNWALCWLLGYTQEELLQKTFQDITHPDDLENDLAFVRQLLAGEINSYQMEKRYFHKSGRVVWALLSVSLVRDEQGQPRYFISQIQDITERRRAEESLRAERKKAEKYLEIAGVMMLALDPDGTVTLINQKGCEILGYSADEIMGKNWIHTFLPRATRKELQDVFQSLIADESQAHYFENSIVTKSGQERLIAWHNTLLRDEEGRIISSLSSGEDITERKQAEAELRASEERFRQLAENIQEAFWMTDARNDQELYMSPAAERIWGRSIQSLMYEPNAFINTVFSEDRPIVLDAIEREKSGEKMQLEYRIVRPDGTLRWLWDRAFPIFDETGSVQKIAGISADITERRESELALVKSQNRYRELFDSSPISIWEEDYSLVKKQIDSLQKNGVVDLKEYLASHPEFVKELASMVRIVDVNKASLELYDLAHKEDLLLSLGDLLDSTSLRHFANEIVELMGPLKRFSWEGGDVTSSGRPIEVMVNGSIPQGYEEDWSKVIVSIIDITERKEVAEKLRESEDRYHSLFQNQIHGSALHEIVTNADGQPVDYIFLKVNPAFEKMTGLEAREILGRRVTEVLPGIENEELMQIYGQVALTGQPAYINDYVTPLGRYYEINAYSTGPGRFAVSFMDITERRQADQELRKLSRAVEQSGSTIVITDTSGKIEYVNPKFTQITGYSYEEIIGQNPRMLKSGFTANEEYKQLWETIRIGQEWHGELLNKKKDGTLYWESVTISPILDDRKEITHYVGVKEDITERKQSEIEIRRHVAELEAVYENGLAVGRLLEPGEIGDRVIETFARYLPWHHVTIRLRKEGSDDLELVSFNLPSLKESERSDAEQHYVARINKVGQGLSGWVIQTGQPLRTGNVHTHPQYIDTHAGIESGLYMPLRAGERVIGVISVESEVTNAFTEQDERLLATLANQTAIAFENARLYEAMQKELLERKRVEDELRASQERFQNLFENSPVATWLEDFSGVAVWLDKLRAQGVENLREYLAENIAEFKHGIGLVRILNVNRAAVELNGAASKEDLINSIHHRMINDTPPEIMLTELEMIWNGIRTFGFELSNRRQDNSVITSIQHVFIPVKDGRPEYESVILTSIDISDRVNIEKELRASEVHYRALADSITDILFELDQDLRYTHWNKASESLTGIPATQAIGKTMAEIMGVTDEQVRIAKIYEDVVKTHQSRIFEITFEIGGQTRYFEVNAYPSTRGVSVVAKDVTDRKRTETIMQKRFELMEYSAKHSLNELMLRTVDEISELTGSSIGFFSFMEDDQLNLGVQTWSTNALQLFQVAPEHGKHLPVDQAGVWAEAVRQRRPLIQNDYEALANRKGFPEGHVPIVRQIVIPIIRNERIMAVLGIANKSQDYASNDLEIAARLADYAWDVTERKQMEIALQLERNQLVQRVEERTADLSRANSNLARALRVKDEFLANMSHELRTPLNAILGLSESLAEQIAGPLNQKQQRYISTISESGHHLLSLINDILDLAKIEAGQITLDINKMDIHSVCQASLRMIKQLAQKKNQEVSLQIDSSVGLMWADERRLKQMIVNLLGNAVKFTPENGKLGLEVRGDQEANQIAITVWDNGIGIKQDDLIRLFQPFVQLNSGLAREATGTGLGLALVAQMARLHGGSVNASSEAGQGSRFTIILPWEPAMAMDTASRMRITGKFRAIQFDEKNKPTILLVEDTKEVVMMLKDYLELAGYRVFTAQDGTDGIVQARRVKPDLILMDVQMPHMDGFETTRKLRSDPNFRYTPIIALTALAMPHDRERCLEAGMDEYMSKPVNLKALVRIIQSCLFEQESSK